MARLYSNENFPQPVVERLRNMLMPQFLTVMFWLLPRRKHGLF